METDRSTAGTFSRLVPPSHETLVGPELNPHLQLRPRLCRELEVKESPVRGDSPEAEAGTCMHARRM